LNEIITLTMNPSVDESTSVAHITPDVKLRCDRPRHDPGGGGINVARAIHILGGKAAAVYPGGGPMGTLLRELLDGLGIDQLPLAVRGWTRQNTIVLEKSSGRQYRFGKPGPELTTEEVDRCLDEVTSACGEGTYLVASGSLPPGVPVDFYGLVARIAVKKRCRLIVDTSGEALRHAEKVGAFLLKPNLRELSHLAGRELKDEREQYDAASEILKQGRTQAIVISLGAGGAVLVTGNGALEIRAPTVPIKSKVGAGDSMVAGITLALSRGQSLEEAVRFGVAAGSSAVMTPGTELCRKEDTERLHERMLHPV
jgi:6-phosphofructokinase 2